MYNDDAGNGGFVKANDSADGLEPGSWFASGGSAPRVLDGGSSSSDPSANSDGGALEAPDKHLPVADEPGLPGPGDSGDAGNDGGGDRGDDGGDDGAPEPPGGGGAGGAGGGGGGWYPAGGLGSFKSTSG